MPEGDTIYRTARALQKALGERVVTGFETQVAKLASVDDNTPLAGRTVERVEARGKWCLIYFSGDLILVSHMLMSGSWHIYRVGERWRLPRKMMRVGVRVGGGAVADPNSVGPDVLSAEFSLEAGVRALQERARTHPDDEIAVVLLNQRVMAGLGNVYKSEVAFAAGVNPFRQMRTITLREMERMVEVSQRYMRANVNDAGARGDSGEGIVTYTGPRRSDRTWVYRRQGQECRRCGAVIEMRKQGAAVRSTYWCPSCQPWKGSE
jgi:endonuclease-8